MVSGKLLVRAAIQTTIWLAFMAVLLFVSAGNWRWPQGWAFIFIFAAGSAAICGWLLRREPNGMLGIAMGRSCYRSPQHSFRQRNLSSTGRHEIERPAGSGCLQSSAMRQQIIWRWSGMWRLNTAARRSGN